MGVKHAGYTVETETIELIFFHPESKIAEEEAENLMVAVVEQPAVPQLVSTPSSAVEVKMIRVVKHVQAVKNVLRSMTVDDVEKDCDTHAVSGVYELLKLVGETVATACREEAVDLVAKTCIVGVLHHRHELDGVVAEVLDSW